MTKPPSERMGAFAGAHAGAPLRFPLPLPLGEVAERSEAGEGKRPSKRRWQDPLSHLR